MPARVEATPLLPGLSPIGGKPIDRPLRRRAAVLGWRPAGVARGRAAARHCRASRRLHRRPARCRSASVTARRDHPLPHADDRRRLRGRQRRRQPARRPDVQARAGPPARRCRPVLAVDRLAAGEPARATRPAAHGPRHGRALLRELPPGAAPHRAGHRRHLRCRPWRAAASAVQRPLRRIRLPADRGVRRRGPPGRRGAAPGLAAHRRRDRAPCCADWCARSAPLAAGGDPAPRRQPLLHARGAATSAVPNGWTSCSASPRPPRCAGMSRRWRRAPPPGAPPRPGRGKLRRFKEFYDGAGSWSRVERIIARVEAGAAGRRHPLHRHQPRRRHGRTVYEDIYCARGQAENHIKAWKPHLAADRTSCCRASANQLRLFLHAGAYWLMWTLRA